MPTAPKTHKQKQTAKQHKRPSACKQGYDRTWQKVRRMQLAAEPLCRACLQSGRVRGATEVDHITALQSGGPRLEPDNLQSLCKPCHSRKTRRENAR